LEPRALRRPTQQGHAPYHLDYDTTMTCASAQILYSALYEQISTFNHNLYSNTTIIYMTTGQGMNKLRRGSAQNATRAPKIGHDLGEDRFILHNVMADG